MWGYWALDQHHLCLLVQSCLRRAGRGVLPPTSHQRWELFSHSFYFWFLKPLTTGPVQSTEHLRCPTVGGESRDLGVSPLTDWSKPDSRVQGSRKPLVYCGCRHFPPSSMLCPQLPVPQRQLLLAAYSWTLSHYCGLQLMFGFTVKKKGPKWNIPDLFSCQFRPLFSVLPKWALFLVGLFRNSASAHHNVQLTPKRGLWVDSQNFISTYA